MSLAQLAPATAKLIHSTYGHHRAFLEVVRQGDRVRVQPTSLGNASLNSFWPMWLRMLLQEKTAHKYGFAVEFYRDNVIVSSSATYEGLEATVINLAAEIRPLMHLPLRRLVDVSEGRSYGPIDWDMLRQRDDNYVPVAFIRERMHLPRGVTLFYDPWWHRNTRGSVRTRGILRLEYRNPPIPGRELAMLVELHFALACCT